MVDAEISGLEADIVSSPLKNCSSRYQIFSRKDVITIYWVQYCLRSTISST
jgi:hypothetical protein